jgi:hypothetical protein
MFGSMVSRRKHKPQFAFLSKRLELLALMALHAFPAIHYPSSTATLSTPAAILDQICRENLRAGLAAMPLWERTLTILIWPPAMVLWGVGLTLANGAHVARRYRHGRIGQFADQMRLAFTRGIPVSYFYTFELHDPHRQAHAHEYLLRGQIKGGGQLYKSLYQKYPERSEPARILNDKLAFHRFCTDHGLPTAQLFAVVDRGSFSWIDRDRSQVPQVDLFFKPRKECGGTGAERWRFADDGYLGHRGDRLDAKGLTKRLARLSRRQPYLVFECLANHPDIQDLSAGALSTLRIHTILNEKYEVEHLFTMLRMSQFRRRIIDTADGIAAAVDPATGVLGIASNSSLLARWMTNHPATRARIIGRQVPYWPEALDLAISTHRKLASPFIVGWDIAVTQHGPVIIEANKSPDIEIEQRLNGPWGNSRFGELLMHHLTGPTGTGKDTAQYLANEVAEEHASPPTNVENLCC